MMHKLTVKKDTYNDIMLDGIIIAGFDPGRIQIPLHWLKVSGFKGKVQIMEGEFSVEDTPLFEVEV